MSEPLAVSERIEALASAMAEVAAPVGRTIDRVAFGEVPPRVVTFERIDQGIHQRLLGETQPEENLESVRYCDGLVVGEDYEDDEDFELTSEGLILAAADCIRGAAEKLASLPPEEAPKMEEAVQGIARFIVYTVVMFAQLVGEQLLVVELAQAIGVDPVPLADHLPGGGEA